MFDLVDILKDKSIDKARVEKTITTVLFYQTEQCSELVRESFTFEGYTAPEMLPNNDDKIKEHVRNASVEIVIVELNASANITKDMERISHLLPNEASVIVVGSEDAISTIRNLKGMGFYYVFWPISKQELIDFIKNVDKNRQVNSGLGKDRSAKNVAVWGSKGGVGATMLTSEISFELSEKRSSTCIVVDHDYRGGNLDIFLGLKKFEKRPVTVGSLTSSLDGTFASSLLKRINKSSAILALESDELNEIELKDYTRTLSKLLVSQYNFILEDLSRSTNSKADLHYIAANVDIFVLVIEPTVSSVREARRLLAELKERLATCRIITVLNYSINEKAATLTIKEIEEATAARIDIVIPHEPQAGRIVLEGKRLYQQKLPIAQQLNNLTSLLLGESLETAKPSLMSRLLKR